MPPVDRCNPTRAASSESTCALLEFTREFPDDEACLQRVWRDRFAPDGEHARCPRCERVRVFKRYDTAQKRPCWFCSACGFRIHPLKGTIFQGSSTSLQLWFYAMFLITSNRCGVSAKQLERELGVTYKTAWRMFNRIRNVVMAPDDEPLSGEVEVDETFIGGKMRASERRRRTAMGVHPKNPILARKTVVYGAVERGGRVRASVIPNSRANTLLPQTREYVLPGSLIYTDEWQPYMRLGRIGYTHRRIRHNARIYVDGDIHTQTIDGFFSLLKNGIRATHQGVSTRWLQGYCNEYAWRWNRRDSGRSMFHDLLASAMA